MKIFVTGAAGFIGFHLCKRLIKEGIYTIGYDNFNSYYDPKLKESRHKELLNNIKENSNYFELINGDIQDYKKLKEIFENHQFNIVVNLAAQAGVRYSIDNPKAYIESNLVGFGNILECCRNFKIKHLIYASSSSVYGGNFKLPFSEIDSVDHPVSLYAATKKSNELMAHAYSHLYNIPTTGLRFFTVYGPWGRPDMAPMIFTKNILEGKPIDIFNNGNMFRDFTYIDDVIESTFRILKKIPYSNPNFNKEILNPAISWAPYKIFNVGNNNSIPLMDFINLLEQKLSKKAVKKFRKMQAGDVKGTAADTKKIEMQTGFRPDTSLAYGLEKFVDWYLKYFSIK